MNDSLKALQILSNSKYTQRQEVLQDFYNRWKHESTVFRHWLVANARNEHEDSLIQKLSNIMNDPAFNLKYPNHVRSTIGVFGHNYRQFHKIDGSGYKFVADFILSYDSVNRNVAAGLAHVFQNCKKYGKIRLDLMQFQINRLLENKSLSSNVREILELIRQY